MGRKNQKRLIFCAVLLLLGVLPLSAQSDSAPADSVVRLLSGRHIRQFELNGKKVREALDATFLHNGTYLTCDSTLWHEEGNVINCYGHVQLMQGESVLTSEELIYLVEEDLAQFRGGVVELRNKQDNVLRTHFLDYNTKDSLAVFHNGASMIGEDGQIIESDEGTYANALNQFKFVGNVNMYTDSVFVRTSVLDYDSNTAQADFRAPIDFWKDGDMLSAGTGWYKRHEETFFFRDAVHGLGKTSETWSDSLYYYRNSNDILMLGGVQIQDQSRKVAAMGDRMHYIDSLSRTVLDERASVAIWDGEGAHPDTTYLGASRFVYEARRMCDISEEEVGVAEKRLAEMLEDPVSAYRQRAAQQAAEAAAEARKNDPLAQAAEAAKRAREMATQGEAAPADTSSFADSIGDSPLDSLAVRDSSQFADLIGEAVDSLAVPPPDTTKVGFLLALGDIRIFRKDMQVRCDSLRYTDLDSIARLYIDPVVWSEERRQYNSDSLYVLIRGSKMERANLMSNAFIHTEEPGGYYDQIKSTDVIAYFSDSTSLRRFDALGGVTSLIYLEENDVIATANKTESQMMMATFDDQGNADHVYNFDSPKSDAYPVAQMASADHRLKGFNWQPERRPKDKYDVTSMVVKDSEREEYEAHPQAEFRQTEIYFPGHMKAVYAALEAAKEKRASGAPPSEAAPDDTSSLAGLPVESRTDSLAVRDSLAGLGRPVDEGSLSEAKSASADRPGPGTFTEEKSERDLRAEGGSGDTPPSEEWMSPRELRRALRIARRDARWAELDQRDAEKAARKEARKEERKARRAARVARAAARQAAIDEAKLQKYIEYYQKKKERDEARKQKSVSAGKRTPRIEARGELPAPAEPDREAP